MKSTLNVVTKILAVSDPCNTQSNPRLRAVDWTREISGVEVENAKTEPIRLEAGETLTVFDESHSTSIDGTTEFDVSLMSIGEGSRYRIAHSAGTAPAFRVDRSIAAAGIPLTLIAQANGSLRMSAGAAVFTAVQVGDDVFIPSTVTGDTATNFSILNAGLWSVLGKTDNTDITLVRPDGTDFEGVSEIVTPASNSDLQIFSASGVQVGDRVAITAGFNVNTQRTFDVLAVTPSHFEISSSKPLVEEAGVIPGAAGMAFYGDACRFIYLESTQLVAVRVNGVTDNRDQMEPTDVSDSNQPGQFMKRGPTWSLALVNLSSVETTVVVIRAE